MQSVKMYFGYVHVVLLIAILDEQFSLVIVVGIVFWAFTCS